VEVGNITFVTLIWVHFRTIFIKWLDVHHLLAFVRVAMFIRNLCKWQNPTQNSYCLSVFDTLLDQELRTNFDGICATLSSKFILSGIFAVGDGATQRISRRPGARATPAVPPSPRSHRCIFTTTVLSKYCLYPEHVKNKRRSSLPWEYNRSPHNDHYAL
jgi:hypothetical protein